MHVLSCRLVTCGCWVVREMGWDGECGRDGGVGLRVSGG